MEIKLLGSSLIAAFLILLPAAHTAGAQITQSQNTAFHFAPSPTMSQDPRVSSTLFDFTPDPKTSEKPYSGESLADAPEFSFPFPGRSKKLDLPSPGDRPTRPFKSLAVGFTAGLSGLGVDLSTPIRDRYNLRAGASFFAFSAIFHEQGVPVQGTIHLASARVVLDYAPTGRTFHISPGLTIYNRDHYRAAVFIAGNQKITFNDKVYFSDPADPIRGSAIIQLANRPAPRLTVGWGNMIRHRTASFSFPMELGVEYINPPKATFNLSGSSCDNTGVCTSIIADADTQQNIIEEQQSITNDLRPLRFFPIISFGVSYKFGH